MQNGFRNNNYSQIFVLNVELPQQNKFMLVSKGSYLHNVVDVYGINICMFFHKNGNIGKDMKNRRSSAGDCR